MPKFTHIFCDSDIRGGFMFARKYSGHKVHLITMCPTLVGWDKENDKAISDGTYYILTEKMDLSRGSKSDWVAEHCKEIIGKPIHKCNSFDVAYVMAYLNMQEYADKVSDLTWDDVIIYLKGIVSNLDEFEGFCDII